MSNQVYPSSVAAAYLPTGIPDLYTNIVTFDVPGTSGPAWEGTPLGVSHCNGIAGTNSSGIITYANGAFLHNQTKYLARTNQFADGGGTIFHILETGVFDIQATVAWETPGEDHFRGIGISITEPGVVAPLPLINCQSAYTFGIGSEGYAQSTGATLRIAAGSTLRIVLLSDDAAHALPVDRGARTLIRIAPTF